MASVITPKQALAFVEKHGIALQAALRLSPTRHFE